MFLLILLVVVIFVAAASFSAMYVGRAMSRTVGRITKQEFDQRINEGWKVLDIRTKKEYDAGHIPGAVCVDYYNSGFKDAVSKLDKNEKYLLYCRTGVRSSKARGIMESLGLEMVADLEGGYISWRDA